MMQLHRRLPLANPSFSTSYVVSLMEAMLLKVEQAALPRLIALFTFQDSCISLGKLPSSDLLFQKHLRSVSSPSWLLYDLRFLPVWPLEEARGSFPFHIS